MRGEMFKIGRACAIGSGVCVGSALVIMPTFWWLGLVAGIAGGFVTGYFAYDLQKIIAKSPKAFAQLAEVLALVTGHMDAVAGWFKRSSRYFLTAAPVGLVSSLWVIERVRSLPYVEFAVVDWTIWGLIIVLGLVAASFICFVLAEVGNNAQRPQPEYRRESFGAVWSDLAAGGQAILIFCVWRFWGYVLSGSWELIKLIHCRQRLLCATDSVLGGLTTLIGFHYWAPLPLALNEYLMAVLFGALIGAAVGIVNWELVSKRYFKFGLNDVTA